MQKQSNYNQDEQQKTQFAGGKQDEKFPKDFEKPSQRDEEQFDEEDDGIERAPARENDAKLNRTSEQKDKKSRV